MCQRCGALYVQRSLRQKFCGDRKKKTGCSYLKKKEDVKVYLRTNKNALRELNKKWRMKNVEKVRLAQKMRYRKLHPLKNIIKKTEEEKKELSRLRNKKYYYKHRSRLMHRQNQLNQKKIQNNISYKIKVRVGFQIWKLLRCKKNNKKTIDFLGCDVEFLKKYLESKFVEGMTWDNYGRGGWVIDHIYPVSRININNTDEINKVFHYTNLQPLWERDNLLKGNRV